MKFALAAAVVLLSLGMSHAQAGVPAQAPDQTPAQPAENAPQSAQPDSTPQVQAPPTPGSGQEVKPEVQPPPPTPTPSEPEVGTPPQKSTAESSKKPASKTTKKKPQSHRTKKPDPPSSNSSKKVVANGGTSEPQIQIAPRLSDKQQVDERQKISSLLFVTEGNLQKVSGRTLKDSEEEMEKQIRMYMDQAKVASEAGDLQRAQNLASKANLLSVELVGK
jgi:type IV secretory pathway VirB10-like protein